MKWSTLLLSLLLSLSTFSQKPETVYSFVKELKPNSFYLEQMDAWENEIGKDSSNANAWYMLYQANRYVSMEDEASGARNARLNTLIDKMELHIPNTFEYHLAKYRQSGNDLNLANHLLKAYELGPDRVEIFSEIVTYYAIIGESNKFEQLMKKWYHSGDNSPGLLNYNNNMLAGLEQDAILLTVGDNDTYPAWKMQIGEGQRPDVLVLNAYLLLHEQYRENIFNQIGLAWDIDPWESEELLNTFKKGLVLKLAENKNERPVYVTISAGKEFIESVKDDLYLTGLVFQYCETPLDNLAILKNNIEHKYALDYLTVQFGPDITRGVVKRMNRNYIVPLLTLYDHYKLAGDLPGMEYTRSLALTIAQGTPEEAEVKSYFE